MTDETTRDQNDQIERATRPRRRQQPEPQNPHRPLMVERELSHPGD